MKAEPAFRQRLEEKGILNITRCMQCMKCGVGCPVAFAMDYNPTQIIRMAILGMKDEVLSSHTIRLCSSCVTCTTRCPMEIDVTGVMDALKEIADEDGYASPEKETTLFNYTFMGVVRARGRVNEPILFAHYKLKSKRYFEDMDKGREMMKKGKIKYARKVKGHDEVKKVIDKVTHKP